MPPSLAMRCSPRRELSMDRSYKKGCSFETRSPPKDRDDDLALFNDMQLRERDYFLLHSNEDFEDSLSTLNCFPDFKLNIPVRGVSRDLMNVDGERNDYDWLLTPPDTPLFPSLDDDEPTPTNLLYGSRSPSQPITISRSLMEEKGYRTRRRSASPHQHSTSPKSGSIVPQLGGKALHVLHSGPNPVLQPTQPSRRSASPTSKPSTSIPESSTPILRRMSTGSSGNMSSSRRGASPVKASRGNSASPKLQRWQSSLSGFSSNVLPNLQTSLSDRTSSHSRHSSPAYRNRGGSPLRSGRQSLSPTASKSASFSHSHVRDQLSSHSKCSNMSSCDDNLDTLYSDNTGISARTTLPRENKTNMFLPKKPSRAPSANIAPKRRSFDSVTNQMHRRRSPQNMFRPLLSSVPTSTFYAGNTTTMHHTVFSGSSLTTSSNASYELGTSAVLDTEGSEQFQNNIARDWEKLLDIDVQEEIFTFDKMDEVVRIVNEVGTRKPQNVGCDFGGSIEITESEECKQLISSSDDVIMAMLQTSESSHNANDQRPLVELDFIKRLAVCSKCSRSFQVSESLNDNDNVCQGCAEADECTSSGEISPGLREAMEHVPSVRSSSCTDVVVDESCGKTQSENVLEIIDEAKNIVGESQDNAGINSDFLLDICPVNTAASDMQQHLLAKKLEFQSDDVSLSCDANTPEGAGISVLLKSCDNGKWPIMQRTFTAANVFCSKSFFIRDTVNASMISISKCSSSASSSIDLGSARNLKAGAPQQLSSSKADSDVYSVRSEPSFSCQGKACINGILSSLCEDWSRHQCTENSLNDLKGCVIVESASSFCPDLTTSHGTDGSILSEKASCSDCMMTVTSQFKTSCDLEEDSSSCWGKNQEMVSRAMGAPLFDAQSQNEVQPGTNGHMISMEGTEFCGAHPSPARILPSMGDKVCNGESCSILDSSTVVSNNMKITLLNNQCSLDMPDGECHALSTCSGIHPSWDGRDAENMACKMSDSLSFQEDDLTNDSPCRTEVSETLSHSLCTTEAHDDVHEILVGQQIENEAHQSTSTSIETAYAPVSPGFQRIVISNLEDNSDHAQDNHRELAITVEGPGGNKSRCLTLEEATDTILFCSSIVHDLAFKAAAIGMEKEQPTPEETDQPIAITSAKPAFDDKYLKRTPPRRKIKPPKARRTQEMDGSIPLNEPEDIAMFNKSPPNHTTDLPIKAGDVKPMKLESKCNCTIM